MCKNWHEKIVLKTAINTHLILDLQDVAWYMSQVDFKTPQVKSFFSKHDHFEYSQIAVEQDQQDQPDEEALVTGDYWQLDGLRRELIRHHKDKRHYLHEMQRSKITPIPQDQPLDERETHIEYQESKKKVLHKDNWRTEKKRFYDKMEECWKGKTVYKIKEDYVIPEDVVRNDIDRQAKLLRDDMFHPESAPSSKPVSVQKQPGSQQREAGKKLLRGPGLRQVEAGPAPDEGSSKRKKVVVSYPDEGEVLDRIAQEMGLQPDDEPEIIASKSAAPARARSKQDSKGQIEKLGSEAFEPRRVSVPLPCSEVHAMTPAYKKMLRNLKTVLNWTNFMSNTITCLLLNSEEGLPCLDFLIL